MDPITLIFALGALIASYMITAMFMPKPETPKPSALEDFDFPQIDDGAPQTVIFGDVWISDWQVLWYGNMRTSAVKADQASK
ncbi:MAG: hypothetical protein P0Y65_13800 [Candidatus Devosia phytovorans]|uniref:Tail assembly protein n=1 Tax=Candidatus Devosia phytovorans TaxID=3121372 RepID=A0AAJ5VSF0_9HYPH|nr:hypothetical protein [Devosia sp.]WEK03265.1 MAG: hypothetical protein P0Y65_13800 [Devosia sp.]